MATTKNITMKQFNGKDYDTLYPKTKVEQVKGAYTQQQILSNATKTLYGLGSSAVPDDVFSWIFSWTAQEAPKIETGSYVGTGRYGDKNKNEILFDRMPVIVIVSSMDDSYNYSFTWIEGVKSSHTTISKQVYSRESNKFIWYSTDNAQVQLNAAGATYFYAAITI